MAGPTLGAGQRLRPGPGGPAERQVHRLAADQGPLPRSEGRLGERLEHRHDGDRRMAAGRVCRGHDSGEPGDRRQHRLEDDAVAAGDTGAGVGCEPI